MNGAMKIQILDSQICLKSGTSLGVNSSDVNETKDILYNLANIKLKSVIYMMNHNMLYENMNVLEYLMFASKHLKKSSTLSQQQELFDLLTTVGLGYISLTPIKLLTSAEKMVILLCIALFSNESYLVYDITEYEFSTDLLMCMKQLIVRLKKPFTTLIIGTTQPKLIGICLQDTLFIHDHNIHYYGSVHDLYHSMDRVLYVIKHKNIDELVKRLERAFPMYEIRNGDYRIFVMRKEMSVRNDSLFFETLAKEQIVPDRIKINHGKIENSFQELIEFNALLK